MHSSDKIGCVIKLNWFNLIKKKKKIGDKAAFVFLERKLLMFAAFLGGIKNQLTRDLESE